MNELTIKSYVKIKSYEELVELTEWVGLYRGYADNIYVEKKLLRNVANKELIVKHNRSNCFEVFDPDDKYCEVVTIPKSFVKSYITRGEV